MTGPRFLFFAVVVWLLLTAWSNVRAVESAAPLFLIEIQYPRDPAGWQPVAGAANFEACMGVASYYLRWYDKRMSEPPRVRCVLNRGAVNGKADD